MDKKNKVCILDYSGFLFKQSKFSYRYVFKEQLSAADITLIISIHGI